VKGITRLGNGIALLPFFPRLANPTKTCGLWQSHPGDTGGTSGGHAGTDDLLHPFSVYLKHISANR
jgi:hypothetical protein